MQPGGTGVLNAPADRARIAARLNRILRAAGHIPAALRWQSLRGGRTNLAWRLQGASGQPDLVCKLSPPGRDTPLFPNRPEIEAQVLHHLADTGLTPRLATALGTDMGHCLLYHHVAGTPGAAGPDLTRKILEQLHRVVPPVGLRVLSAAPSALLAAGEAMLQDLDADLRATLRRLRPMPLDLPAVAPVFLHGDPVPGNILATAAGACLLDLQCPALGDPLLDYALALSPAMNTLERGAPLSRAERAVLLADPEIATRFATLEPFLVWRMAAYCGWRIARGHAAYGPALLAELERLDRLAEP